jgi:acetylornithine deacetylase/succinyl-diaminopimelate desuccinylase-like protein
VVRSTHNARCHRSDPCPIAGKPGARRLAAPRSEGSLRALPLLLLLCVACSGGALLPFVGGPRSPDPAQDLRGAATAILSAAIRINTVNPPGDEEPLADFYVATLRRQGIEARRIETPRDGASKGRAAAWARLPGLGAARPVILLSHLDVVPADAESWLVDPFEGVVAGGYVMGRGALDAKSVSVVHLLTLVELARRARPLDRDVIFLATPDEETGGRLGAGYVVNDRPELLLGAEYLLTEGGGILDARARGPNVWGVTVTEKSPCWMRLVARGEPGHASAAAPDSAVPRLVRALEKLRRMETEIRVVPEVARMFEVRARSAPPEERFFLRNLAFALETDPSFRGRFLAVPAQNVLVRDTLAITQLHAGARTNVVPAEASAHVDARLLPGTSCAEFAAELEALIADRAVQLEIQLSFPTLSSPVDTPLFQAIERTAGEMDPGAVVVPQVISGFTDAHYFREAGVVAYGFAPRWLPPHESTGIHGPNERISVDNLERGVRTLVRILEELAAR